MNELTRSVALLVALLNVIVKDYELDAGEKAIHLELRALAQTLLERSEAARGYQQTNRGAAALVRAGLHPETGEALVESDRGAVVASGVNPALFPSELV